jgi:predicted Zn-dependent protease
MTPRIRGFGGGRILIALVLAGIALVTYFSQSQHNPITGETQYLSMTTEQEVALGFQAAPELANQHGGLHPDEEARALVERVGRRIVERSAAGQSGYPFEFHLLADESMINAFALPGGPVFITAGMLSKLRTEGELAGVLGHEIAHVVARHGAEHIAKAQLTQGLTGAAVIATYDPENPASRNSAQVLMMIGQLVNMKFGRDDELESDRLGVQFSAAAGYDPRAMIGVMEVLAEASQGQAPPEFFSTHPNPENRVERIQQFIAEQFPGGVPGGLIP